MRPIYVLLVLAACGGPPRRDEPIGAVAEPGAPVRASLAPDAAPLPPPPPPPSPMCCCDEWDGHGEVITLRAREVCPTRPYGACIDDGFCR